MISTYYQRAIFGCIILSCVMICPSLHPYSTDKQLDIAITTGGKTIEYQGITYYLYEPDFSTQEVIFQYRNDEQNTSQSIAAIEAEYGERLAFATNGGIFKTNLEPVGLLVYQGKEMFPLNTNSGPGNFYLKPNGVFYVNRFGSPNVMNTQTFAQAFKNDYRNISWALQSGPMLFTGGNINPAFNPNSSNRYIRSGVGLVNYREKRIVFALSKTPVTLYQFADFMRNGLKCTHGLYLDGNISQMYNPDINLGIQQANGAFSVIVSVINN